MRTLARPIALTLVVTSSVLLAILLLLLALDLHISAAVDVVVGNGTAGSCTVAALRSAVASGGTVTFNCPANERTFVVPTDGNAPLIINTATTIDGGGVITLSGGNTNRVIVANAPLTLKNITITRGKDPNDGAGGGGAIYLWAPLVLENVTVSHSLTEFGSGGAILSQNMPMTATNTIFEHNSAVNGGALYPRFGGGKFILKNVTLRHNEARYTGGDSGWGGAILLWDGAIVEMKGGSVHDNNAYRGGASYLRHANSSLYADGTVFKDNVATQSGGAVYSENGFTQMKDSSFEGNSVCCIGNASFAEGGAITQRLGRLNIYTSSFVDNQVTAGSQGASGGALYVRGGLFVESSTFLQNQVQASGSARGGAIWTNDEDAPAGVSILRSTFQFNIAGTEGGGVYVNQFSTANIYGSTFAGNASYLDGGAILVRPVTDLTLTNVTFGGNEADRYGGALMIGSTTEIPPGTEDGKITMSGVTIDENSAGVANGGGAIYRADPRPLVFTNVVFSDNTNGNCNIALPATGIVYSTSSDGTCALQGATNHNNLAALLGGLWNNGGPVLTILPQAGSPLIDAGTCTSALYEDARQVTRPQGAACDIGAVEVAPTPPATATPTNTPTRTPVPTASFTPTRTPTPTATNQGPTATPTNTPIPPLGPPDDTLVIEPNAETTAEFETQDGHTIGFFIPEGAVDSPTNLELRSALDVPTSNLHFLPGAPIFRLHASVGGTLQEVFVFNEPIYLQISYTDEDVAGLDEESLSLYYYDPESRLWGDDGIGVYERDLEANTITVTVEHLTLFALGNSADSSFLPLVGD